MFNPTRSTPGQWADAAVAAKMTYGVLTTRHHDGFALWPSTVGSFNVRNIPWMNGQGDVVRAYVDAFRAKGLQPGLYYSVWDSTQGIGGSTTTSTTVTAAQMAYVRQQLTELLTNYGPIPILIIDGWSWRMGHKGAAYEEIRALVKSLQPDCLLTDHTHLQDPVGGRHRQLRGAAGRVRRPRQHLRRPRNRRSTPAAATTGSGRPTSAA